MNFIKSLFVILLSACSFAATNKSTTITGTFTDPAGSPFNGSIVLSLPFAGAVTQEGKIVPPVNIAYVIQNGTILPSSAQLINNIDIVPGNTYYLAKVYDYTNSLISSYYVAIPDVATFDLGSAQQSIYTAGNISLFNPTSLTVFPYNIADLSTGTSFVGYGDSFAFCNGLVNQGNCWQNVFSQFKHFTLANAGVNSTGVADAGQFGLIVQLLQGNIGSYGYCCAINDMRNNLNSTQQATWQHSYEALLWWLATPEVYKVRSTSGAVTYGGGCWALPPQNYSGNMNGASCNGATATFLTTGTDVVVVAGYQTANTSTWSVTVDGSYTTPTVTTNTGAFCTVQFNTCFGPYLLRIPGLNEAVHTVTFTCITAAPTCYFIAGGTSYGGGPTGPLVYALETTRACTVALGCAANGYNITSVNCGSTPCGSDALVTTFDTMEREVTADLAAAGLNVVFVPVNAFYAPSSTNTQSDGLHPTDAGSTLFGTALISTAKSYLTPMDRGAAQLLQFASPCVGNAAGSGFFSVGISCIPGMQRGDLGSAENTAIGQVWFGADGLAKINRNANQFIFTASGTNGAALCFTSTVCLYSGAGVPGINCGVGSVWYRNDAPSASTVEYVCQPANTWTAITVP